MVLMGTSGQCLETFLVSWHLGDQGWYSTSHTTKDNPYLASRNA